MYMYTQTYIYTHIYIHIYRYIYTYKYMYIHIQLYTCMTCNLLEVPWVSGAELCIYTCTYITSVYIHINDTTSCHIHMHDVQRTTPCAQETRFRNREIRRHVVVCNVMSTLYYMYTHTHGWRGKGLQHVLQRLTTLLLGLTTFARRNKTRIFFFRIFRNSDYRQRFTEIHSQIDWNLKIQINTDSAYWSLL